MEAIEHQLDRLWHDINKLPRGLRSYRGDLHVHTPASRDYKDQCTVYDVCRRAQEVGLDFIALADHNNCDGYAQFYRGPIRDQFPVVFAAVEITAPGGKRNIHITAVFEPESPPDLVNDLLARIGITYQHRGGNDAVATKEPTEILNEIEAAGGIAIAAHADLDSGVSGGLRGQQRVRLLQDRRLWALELVDLKEEKFFDGSDPNYRRQIACIQGSDSHSLASLGQRSFQVLLGRPNLDGLKMAFLDPQFRLHFPQHPAATFICGLAIRGGFFSNDDSPWSCIRFNPGLNCLIGGRGSGKSTVIEVIRACLSGRDSYGIVSQYAIDEAVLIVMDSSVLKAIVVSSEGKTEYFHDSARVWRRAPANCAPLSGAFHKLV